MLSPGNRDDKTPFYKRGNAFVSSHCDTVSDDLTSFTPQINNNYLLSEGRFVRAQVINIRHKMLARRST